MPVFSAAGAAIAGAIFGSGAASAIAIGATLGQFAGGLALNALASSLADPVEGPSAPAIRKTADVGVVPRSIILGRTATPGSRFFEQTSGLDTDEEKRFYVVGHVLSDVPVRGLVEIWVNDLRCTIGGTYVEGRGYPIIPPPYYAETVDAWVTFYDGTQTTADPVLLAAAEPGYEWDETDILRGCAYAVCVFRGKREVFPTWPQPLYVVDGAELDDAQTGQAGTGDDLVAVQVANLLSGIRYGDELVYGPQMPGTLQNAASEIAKCRAPVPGAETWTDQKKMAAFGSLTVPSQYRAGMEIPVNMPIADALSEIMAAANAKISFTGSGYVLSCGEPGAPVASIGAQDIILDREQSFSPFLPLPETVNSFIATYPEPKKKWSDREVRPLIVPAYEEEDGGRRLTATIQLRALPYGEQVQRVRKLALDEARRAARLTFTLTPASSRLLPLDVITLTHPRSGSLNKLYRVDGRDLERSGRVTLDLTEIDDSWSWQEGDFDASEPAPVTQQPVGTYDLLGFDAEKYAVRDQGGAARRPAIKMSWLVDQAGRHIAYRIFSGSSEEIATRGTAALEDGSIVTTDGIVPNGRYEVQARKIKGRGKTPWSARISVTVDGIGISPEDFEDIFPGAPVMNDPTTRLASDGSARITFSWSAVVDSVSYDLQVSEGGAGFVSLPTTETASEIKAIPGIEYSARVRSMSGLGNKSGFSATVTIVAAADAVPPPVPTGLVANSGFETIWLEWAKVSAPDLAFYEIVEKATNTAPATNTTAPVYRSTSNIFARTGIGEGVTRYYWVRAVDTSGNRSAWSTAGAVGTSIKIDFASLTGQVTAAQLVSSELITLSAQIRNAIITDAKIATMSAAKLIAGSAMAGSITVDGTALGTVQSRSDDPATRINQVVTQIDPGRIKISTGTSLADWRKGGDETRIDGGQVSANTILANAMVIGSRNVTTNGIEFEHNKPAPNRVSWTAGFIRYINDSGNATTVAIPANDVGWSGGVIYIYWVKDQSLFRATTDQATAFGADRMVLATYQGGRMLNANFGQTVVDGAGIKTGSVTAGAGIFDYAAIRTLDIQFGDIVVFGQAGSGLITNNADSFTDISELVINTNVVEGPMLGTFSFTLSAPASSYPNDFAIQVLLNGDLLTLFNKQSLNADPSQRVVLPLSKNSITASPIVLTSRIKNGGGNGVAFSNLSALAAQR